MPRRDEFGGDDPSERTGVPDDWADNPPPDPPGLGSDVRSTIRGDVDGSADDDALPEFRPGDEPVPGYRLVARRGTGATGVVWEAVGPGGFPSALKITRLGAKRSHELGSLDLVRGLRHAHLLPVFGAWERDGCLVVGMELADGTLSDRLARAVRRGLPGVPFPELVLYMDQAARGIDYLNDPDRPGGGIRHCDIKPQNLLLVGDTVKVGDFGLARAEGHDGSDLSRESLTPAFAAPELAKLRPTDRSDQYSLAVTYVLLRGGRLPFAGTSWTMLMDHAAAPPDLSMLPEAERPVVARALAKRPQDRWADCRAFVRELARVGPREAARPARRRSVLVPEAAAVLLVVGLALGSVGRMSVPGQPDLGPGPDPRAVESARAVAPAEPRPPEPAPPEVVPPLPEPRLVRAVVPPVPLAPLVAALQGWAEHVKTAGVRATEAVEAALAQASGVVARGMPSVRLPALLAVEPRVVVPAEAVAVAPPPRAARRTATIRVKMPAENAELVVRGAVGRGNPDEWYGTTRVIHTPPLGGPADYLVGAFWVDADGRPANPTADLRVEPGRVYEVDLRGAEPSAREVSE